MPSARCVNHHWYSNHTLLQCFLTLSDLFPLREVASLRSYVNIAATTGRSLGGPIGGALADTIGWRWYVSLYLGNLADYIGLSSDKLP
jgi:MFS family permease